ncbi:MAG: hypothetical protein IT385_20160 [Deltaproteobacteria bacterium]|nr:hypothetical protein [Deltaproteobacteria bacterium]
MKKLVAIVWAGLMVACGSSGSGGGGGAGPATSGKALTDEQVCREDSPCKNVQGSEDEFQACMDILRPAAQDPCRQAMVEQRVCVVKNTQCTPDGDPDNAASEAAWETHCKDDVEDFETCCRVNPESVFCAALEH